MPPIAKIAKPITPSIPKIGAERSVIAAGAPVVNEEKIISMKIDAIVQDIIGFIGKDQRPMISTRSTNTNVRVNNGETLLIGGLIFDTADEMNNKVPLLGDIPIIKRLFNYNNKTKEQRELLIFITPTVVLSDA